MTDITQILEDLDGPITDEDRMRAVCYIEELQEKHERQLVDISSTALGWISDDDPPPDNTAQRDVRQLRERYNLAMKEIERLNYVVAELLLQRVTPGRQADD